MVKQCNQSDFVPPQAQAFLPTSDTGQSVGSTSAVSAETALSTDEAISTTPSPFRTATITLTPSNTPTPTSTSTPTVTPTPTLNLADCNAAGCGAGIESLPTVEFDGQLLLTYESPKRRLCNECPRNELLSEAEIDRLIEINDVEINKLQEIAQSQEVYEIAPGIVYIVFDFVHHVVVDVEEAGFNFHNIVPPIPDEETREKIRITPSYCLRSNSLVVTTGDYHGLVGSNKTEAGRELFFHLGRAALFRLDYRFDIDVITEHSKFVRTDVSWGGGPLFIFDGKYEFNPKQEWFEPDVLDHYRTTRWAKITAAVSRDRKYLFLSSSFDLTLEQHAENIIALGETWGIPVDRAMRFDGSESAYMAIRLGDHMVPLLNLEEPLIVNCLAIERTN